MTAPLRGTGAGWRPEIAAVLDGTDGIGFCEVIAESIDPDAVPAPLRTLRGRGVPVVPHGVGLSLGGTDPVEPARVTHLAACAAALDAPLVSEHVAFVRSGGRQAGHLLCLPRTRDALDVVAANVQRVRGELDVPIVLEPIAAPFDWPEDEFTEAEFLNRLLDRTGAPLLLDVANVYANARNRGRDPRAVLDALPLERVAYCHVAGGSERDGVYHDTHTDPTPDAVLDLLAHVAERAPGGIAPPCMLERDGRYPPADRLRGELAAISRSAGHDSARNDRPGEAAPTGEAAPAEVAAPAAGGPPRDGAAPSRPVPDHAPPDDMAARQSALVGALVAGDADPPGFDAALLAATRAALLRKRAGVAAAHWPRLAAAIGDGWSALFAERFAGVPPTDGLREGWDIARALRDAGRLPAGAAAELAGREDALRYDGASPPVRRPRIVAATRRLRRGTGR